MWTLEEVRQGRLPITLVDIPYSLGPRGGAEMKSVGTSTGLLDSLVKASEQFDSMLPAGSTIITPQGEFVVGTAGNTAPPAPVAHFVGGCSFCRGEGKHSRWCKYNDEPLTES